MFVDYFLVINIILVIVTMSYHKYSYPPQPPKIIFIAGTEERMPKNVGQYDAVICQEVIEAKGPNIRITCNQIMNFHRVYEAGIQFKKGTAICNAWEGHIIQTHQMYVGICDNIKQHCTGKKNICCRLCIENIKHYEHTNCDASFSIVKDYHAYQPKKSKIKD